MRAHTLVLATFLPVFALAQPIVSDAENGRYVLKETPQGFLRMDSRSGQMSLCASGPNGFSCRMVPDDRTAMEAEVKRLHDENDSLRGKQPGLAMRPGASQLPSDAEVDRALGIMGKMMRLFRDVMKEEQGLPQKPL